MAEMEGLILGSKHRSGFRGFRAPSMLHRSVKLPYGKVNRE